MAEVITFSDGSKPRCDVCGAEEATIYVECMDLYLCGDDCAYEAGEVVKEERPRRAKCEECCERKQDARKREGGKTLCDWCYEDERCDCRACGGSGEIGTDDGIAMCTRCKGTGTR